VNLATGHVWAIEVAPSVLKFEQALAFLGSPDACLESERRFQSHAGGRGASECLLTASLADLRNR